MKPEKIHTITWPIEKEPPNEYSDRIAASKYKILYELDGTLWEAWAETAFIANSYTRFVNVMVDTCEYSGGQRLRNRWTYYPAVVLQNIPVAIYSIPKEEPE